MVNRLILGIDNSMDFLSVALSTEERLIEERHIWNRRAPSEILPAEISHLLSRNGYSINDMHLVVVTLGPGSFTGIRVGLAFCKGLHAGSHIPLVGVPTLDALASPFSFMAGHYLCPLIDAKKGEIFSALYYASDGKIKRLTDYRPIKPVELAASIKTPCICFGTGATLCAPLLADIPDILIIQNSFAKISGETLIQEGLRRETAGGNNLLQPIYGRKSEAEIKFNITVDIGSSTLV